jgi:hypothetical protein
MRPWWEQLLRQHFNTDNLTDTLLRACEWAVQELGLDA